MLQVDILLGSKLHTEVLFPYPKKIRQYSPKKCLNELKSRLAVMTATVRTNRHEAY